MKLFEILYKLVSRGKKYSDILPQGFLSILAKKLTDNLVTFAYNSIKLGFLSC